MDKVHKVVDVLVPKHHHDRPLDNSDPRKLYDDWTKVAAGSSSTVYRAKDKKNQNTVCIKVVEIEETENVDEFLMEVNAMKKVGPHKNIVQYLHAWKRPRELCIALEYLPCGSAAELATKLQRPVPEALLCLIIKEALQGIAHIHEKAVIHRDIRAANLMFSDKGTVKLIDFGTAAIMQSPSDRCFTMTGSPYWIAPEVLTCYHRKPYNSRADIWSLGITCLELAQIRPPLWELDPTEAMYEIPRHDPPKLQQPQHWSVNFQEFVGLCLQKDPEKRPPAKRLLEHQWIKQNLADSASLLQYIAKARETTADPTVKFAPTSGDRKRPEVLWTRKQTRAAFEELIELNQSRDAIPPPPPGEWRSIFQSTSSPAIADQPTPASPASEISNAGSSRSFDSNSGSSTSGGGAVPAAPSSPRAHRPRSAMLAAQMLSRHEGSMPGSAHTDDEVTTPIIMRPQGDFWHRGSPALKEGTPEPRSLNSSGDIPPSGVHIPGLQQPVNNNGSTDRRPQQWNRATPSTRSGHTSPQISATTGVPTLAIAQMHSQMQKEQNSTPNSASTPPKPQNPAFLSPVTSPRPTPPWSPVSTPGRLTPSPVVSPPLSPKHYPPPAALSAPGDAEAGRAPARTNYELMPSATLISKPAEQLAGSNQSPYLAAIAAAAEGLPPSGASPEHVNLAEVLPIRPRAVVVGPTQTAKPPAPAPLKSPEKPSSPALSPRKPDSGRASSVGSYYVPMPSLEQLQQQQLLQQHQHQQVQNLQQQENTADTSPDSTPSNSQSGSLTLTSSALSGALVSGIPTCDSAGNVLSPRAVIPRAQIGVRPLSPMNDSKH